LKKESARRKRSPSGGRSSRGKDLALRDTGYLETYGRYPSSSVMELEVQGADSLESLTFRIVRLVFDSDHRAQRLHDVQPGPWRVDIKENSRAALHFDLSTGYYILLASCGEQSSAVPFIVANHTKPADVAVIRPVFTQWSYHTDGFYANDYRSPVDRLLSRVGGLRGGGRFAERALRKAASNLGLRKVNTPVHTFPANAAINLGDFYRRNNRWERTMWDMEWGRQEGLWVDEVLSGMPIFALLEKNDIAYHVYTDVDLHLQNPALESYRVLIFSGQEGITAPYYRMLQNLQSSGRTSFLLWGVQAFGYRELDYQAATGELKYVCTRGHHGMWGDVLEDAQPEWEDEGRLFGFHFPEPRSANWRYDKPYSQIVISEPSHPIVSQAGEAETIFSYEVLDLGGKPHPGLTWAGGEVQQRIAPEATIIAHLDDDREVIGIGEYRNTVLFSPTYLPAFFAYQAKDHPEIETWFIAALNYLTGRKD
jgi:hypothetical protein